MTAPAVIQFDVFESAHIDEVLAMDRVSTPSLRDDADLLERHSPFRPPGSVHGLLVPGRAGGIMHVDSATNEASLGWFSASDHDSGVALLEAGCRVAFAAGARAVVGPKNISTWRRYRCVVDDDGTTPPFLLEPMTQPLVQGCLEAAGFTVARRYATVRIPHVEVSLTKVAMAKAQAAGVRFVPLEDRSDDDFVDIIHGLADTAFQHKTGYRPVGRDHVAFLYGHSRALLVPGCSWLAESDDGRPLGFVVAWPDVTTMTSATPTTVVKTLGVAPSAPSFLGWALMHRHVVWAREHGFSHGLYALMEKARPLLRYARAPARMGGETGTVFRRYALYARQHP